MSDIGGKSSDVLEEYQVTSFITRNDLAKQVNRSSRQIHRWCKRLGISTDKARRGFSKKEYLKILFFWIATIKCKWFTPQEYESLNKSLIEWAKENNKLQRLKEIFDDLFGNCDSTEDNGRAN